MLSDAMRFIPVNLSSAKGSIIEPNRRISFEFPPSSPPMPFPKVLQSVDAAAAGDDLDIRDLPDHLKHRVDRGTPVAGSLMRISRDSDFVVVDQTAFTGSDAALFHVLAEPLVVVHRAGKEIESNLIDGAPDLSGQAGQLRFEFGRNLQVHGASVGGTGGLSTYAPARENSRLSLPGRPRPHANG